MKRRVHRIPYSQSNRLKATASIGLFSYVLENEYEIRPSAVTVGKKELNWS